MYNSILKTDTWSLIIITPFRLKLDATTTYVRLTEKFMKTFCVHFSLRLKLDATTTFVRLTEKFMKSFMFINFSD